MKVWGHGFGKGAMRGLHISPHASELYQPVAELPGRCTSETSVHI